MRLSNGKLKSGAELMHVAPLYMQSEPLDLDLRSTRKQIFTWDEAHANGLDRSVINTEVALEIASWWSTPGSAFAAFAFDGSILPELNSEIIELKKHMKHESSQQALNALAAYIAHSMNKEGTDHG